MDIGHELKRIRTNKKMSIRELAQYSGVSASYISKIERGLNETVSVDVLKKLSTALNVSSLYLIGEDYKSTVDKTTNLFKKQQLLIIKELVNNACMCKNLNLSDKAIEKLSKNIAPYIISIINTELFGEEND